LKSINSAAFGEMWTGRFGIELGLQQVSNVLAMYPMGRWETGMAPKKILKNSSPLFEAVQRKI